MVLEYVSSTGVIAFAVARKVPAAQTVTIDSRS
jgi:hypothetical protein